MRLFRSKTPSQNDNSSLALPAPKRISLPSSQRLTTIIEGPALGTNTPPAIPRRSSRRDTILHSESPRHSRLSSGSTRSNSEGRSRNAPPPYDWVPEPITDSRDDLNPENDEKLSSLPGDEGNDAKRRRGGWLRLALIIGLVLLVIIALAVGLGVGLTKKKSNTTSSKEQQQSAPSSESPDDIPPQKFPLGEYSMVTALKSMQAGCTANPATWRCWPYIVYSPSTTDDSLASFNWILRNTSSTYASNTTSSTPGQGIPANLTVSTQNNPFDITFNDEALTYISPSSNETSARYTFSFTMTKEVDPLPALTPDGATTVCFYNQTTFTGTIYLSAPRNYPIGVEQMASTSLGGYEQWPYAVEVTQTALGGENVPNCYKTVDGEAGARITYELSPLSDDTQCSCDYRNF